METETTITYTTQGSVRGTCGHEHRTAEAAAQCVQKDQRAVRRGYGSNAYSDRRVVRTDGAPLSDAEWDEIDAVAR